jgi:dTMP kinase
VGDRIREILLDRSSHMSQICEAILYMASRAELVASVIRPALERGCIVLSDRYLLANVVYQGHAGEIAPETLWEIGRVATAGILPDLTLVLDLPPEVAQARKDGLRDRLEARGLDFARRVREGFLSEARRDPDRIRVIDAARPADEVQKELQQEVAHVLGSRAGT